MIDIKIVIPKYCHQSIMEPFNLDSDYILSIYDPNIELGYMILEDIGVSYQKIYELREGLKKGCKFLWGPIDPEYKNLKLQCFVVWECVPMSIWIEGGGVNRKIEYSIPCTFFNPSLSYYCYNLLKACENRRISLKGSRNYQDSNQAWNGSTFYQLSLDDRKKFKNYSINRLEVYVSNEENVQHFKKELLKIKSCATYCLTKIINNSMPGMFSN